MKRSLNMGMIKDYSINPDEFSPERAKAAVRIMTNRDFCNGIDDVRRAGIIYLPKPIPEMSNLEYRNFLFQTEMFPSASKTLQSFIGLSFRKPPTMASPSDRYDLDTIVTSDGRTVEQLARTVMFEHAVCNDGGLLIDQSAEWVAGMSQADVEAMQLEPMISVYPAENVRDIVWTVKGTRKTMTLVRLMDDLKTARHLSLENGVYTVTIYEKRDPLWVKTQVYTPKLNGMTLDYIPFVPLNDGDHGAPMDDICATNHTHYLTSASLTTALNWIKHPVMVVTGVAEGTSLQCRSGALWTIEEPNAKWGWNEYKGDGVPALERHLERLEDHMAKLGSRMLGAEKNVAEAAETLARRQVTEGSILAAMCRHVSSIVEKALRMKADWSGVAGDQVHFACNTDFEPLRMDGRLLAQIDILHDKCKLTDRELFDLLQKSEFIPETADFDARQTELESKTVDVPIAPPIIPTGYQLTASGNGSDAPAKGK